jgi:hypothetical protein
MLRISVVYGRILTQETTFPFLSVSKSNFAAGLSSSKFTTVAMIHPVF